MNIFGSYSFYYNLLYQDKDYAGEATYIQSLIQKYRPETKTILDLGCGTGRHAVLLSQKGFKVHGIDISDEMLSAAMDIADGETLTFSREDIRTVRLGKTFDAVISLFHVMSYQVNNEDLQSSFRTAYEHLEAGGVFIFDCWYGPAVLTDRPVPRIKKIEENAIKIIRIAEPVIHVNENIVDVHYYLFIHDKNGGNIKELQETHCMRYLFKPEVELMLKQTGFILEDCFEYMTGNDPGCETWNVCFIAKKTL